jgi:hypothetical protein
MNQKYAMKQRNLLRYLPVPVVISNRFSILENSQHSCEIISEQSQIASSWSDMVMTRQKGVANAKWQNPSRILVAKTSSNLPCNRDACETGNKEVGKQSKKQTSGKKMKHKILIIGDSHGRVCAQK